MADNKFSNRQRALRRMGAMPKAVRDAARSQLFVKEAPAMVAAIKPRVPLDEGELRDSVEWRPTTDQSTKIAVVILEGANGQEEKARANEFGRPDMQAQPHFYPTYRERKGGIRRRMMAAARKAIRVLVR